MFFCGILCGLQKLFAWIFDNILYLLDRFLDARGYVDMDYLNELLGTRYLRAMDYVNAVRVLSKVPNEYKLSFAKSMRDYQKQAES